MGWELIDLAGAADSLRGHPEINDVAALRAPDGRVYVLVHRQGLVYGPWARDIVIDEIGSDHTDVAVIVVASVPRDETGAVDAAACVALGRRAVEERAWVFDLEPAATEHERMIEEILLGLLPLKRLSMTDSLPMVGVDSLVLVELSAAITERFGVGVDAMELFEADDVRTVARLVRDAASVAGTRRVTAGEVPA